jgi:hypothetical protein
MTKEASIEHQHRKKGTSTSSIATSIIKLRHYF